MTVRFQLIVFDWDGTLMDSAAVIASAIQAACRDMGLPVPADEHACHVIGLGMDEALSCVAPTLGRADYPKMHACYRRHYLALSSDSRVALFPGIADLLDWLGGTGRLLAVATGKSRIGLDFALESFGLGGCFHATRCADETFSKPHPAMLEELMDELGVTPERTLMVGDTTYDLQMARNAGVAGVGVAYGAHSVDMLLAAMPMACIGTPWELAQWLRANV
jgi:phosphoglycolate phosphatase